MITDDEVMRLFERADPARVDHVAVRIDAAGYLDALRLESDEQLVPVKEIYVSVDSPPTSETRNRRRLTMAAAAVVAVIGVAAVATNSPNSDDDVAPLSTAAPTVAPTTVAPTIVAPRREAGAFEPPSEKRVTFTVPDGWAKVRPDGSTFGTEADIGNPYFGVVKGDPAIGVVFLGAQVTFYTHYCLSGSLRDPVGPTIDDLVSAWTNLPGVDATAARDVTVDGFDAKEIELTVSAEAMNPKDCSGIASHCSFGQGPTRCKNELKGRTNQELKIWILDIDGERHMIVAGSFPDTSQQDRAALDEIVASIQIG